MTGTFSFKKRSQNTDKTCAGIIPEYGWRRNWRPKGVSDFGDGGAYPEVPYAQYPSGFDKVDNTDNVLQTCTLRTVDENGKVIYDALITQGSTVKKVFTKPDDHNEKWRRREELCRPSEKERNAYADETKLAIENKLESANMNLVSTGTTQFVKYSPKVLDESKNCQKLIMITEEKIDPLEPSRFRHQKMPVVNTEPPVPVQHSPARKVTAQDQKDWKIPPCVSNWKNQKGYTIPLHQRVNADGRNGDELAVNDNFLSLTEALYIAERNAREEIRIRNEVLKEKKARETEQQEKQLQELANRARIERLEILNKMEVKVENNDSIKERQGIISERKREIIRDIRFENARKKMPSAFKDRDISEKVALGQALPSAQSNLYDARLFNKAEKKNDELNDPYKSTEGINRRPWMD